MLGLLHTDACACPLVLHNAAHSSAKQNAPRHRPNAPPCVPSPPALAVLAGNKRNRHLTVPPKQVPPQGPASFRHVPCTLAPPGPSPPRDTCPSPPLPHPRPQVNSVSGPMGITFTGIVSPANSTLSVAPPNPLSNAELAANRLLQYLLGREVLTPQELSLAVANVLKARSTISRGTLGAGRFWSLVDTADVLASTQPALPPLASPPPPPGGRRPPPPAPAPPQPPPAPRPPAPGEGERTLSLCHA